MDIILVIVYSLILSGLITGAAAYLGTHMATQVNKNKEERRKFEAIKQYFEQL